MESFPYNLPAVIKCLSTEETIHLGKRLAALLEKGSIVALRGPLGAGKTCITKGIAEGLGISEEITSPTYTIISEYEALVYGEKIPVYHIDAFRLSGEDDFTAIGGEEIVFGNGISVIEWSDIIPSFVPSGAIRADIEITGENERLFRIYREGAGK